MARRYLITDDIECECDINIFINWQVFREFMTPVMVQVHLSPCDERLLAIRMHI